MLHSLAVLAQDSALSPYARFMKKYGMYSAALYYKNLNEPIERRAARAARYQLEQMPLPRYQDGQTLFALCPAHIFNRAPDDDAQGYGFYIDVNGNSHIDHDRAKRLYDVCENDVEHHIVDTIFHNDRAMYSDPSTLRYSHGGLHNVPAIPMLLQKGILGYRADIEAQLAADPSYQNRMFQEALLDVADGLAAYLTRYADALAAPDPTFTGDAEKRRRLAETVRRVPLHPAESFYEAVVVCDAVMFLSDGFEPGRLDDYLYPYYEADLAAGKTTPEEAYALIRAILEDLEHRAGHPGVTHVTIGGTHADGTPAYNALTEITVRAIQGLRTPNVTLRVRKDMPQELWNLCLGNFGHGFAQPALVNEEMFLDCLTKDYAIPYADAVDYVFGGCSELLIQGKTMVDSTWVAFNTLDIFEHTLYNHLAACDTFEDFYHCFMEELDFALEDLEQQINIRQYTMALHQPIMMRTFFTDGCMQNKKTYTNGGAPYNFDSTNIYGSTNAINSLYTVQKFYEGQFGTLTKEEFLQSLITNFDGREDLHSRMKQIPKFGNYAPELNALAHDVMDALFSKVMTLHCYRKNDTYTGRFMPAIILWVSWIECGLWVGATPDGRVLSEATVDSCGPMQGTDTEGPTSVMMAALSLPQDKCAGTCVLNLRLDAANFKTEAGAWKVQKLFETYFAQGGSQLQINVVDPETLLAAMEEPEKHRDIIVRVGGFSDNFVLLDKRIQTEILKRTQHTV